MAHYFVSSADGDNTDDGTTMDNGPGGGTGAWATVEYALESGGLSAGDIVWIRRTHSEIPVSDIACVYDGDENSPIQIIGCPRNTHSVSSSDWTNGSTSVTIDDNDMDREKHQSRYITAPDGETYLITRVSATNTIIIDREYAGSTQSNQAATIQADEDYDFFSYSQTFTANASTEELTLAAAHPYNTAYFTHDGPVYVSNSGGALPAGLAANTAYFPIYVSSTVIKLATTRDFALAGTAVNITDAGTGTHTLQTINDFSWTIQVSNWTGDADDVPLIDFNDGAFQLILSSDNWHQFKNMEFKDSTDAAGIIYILTSRGILFSGCLIKQSSSNTRLIRCNNMLCVIERCTIEGSGAGAAQVGMLLESAAPIVLKDVAMYNLGDLGITSSTGLFGFWENVNIGVEQNNGDYDIRLGNCNARIYGRDIKLGGGFGYFFFAQPRGFNEMVFSVENWQKVLGNNRSYWSGGYIERSDVTGDTPNKKVSDYIIEIVPNQADAEFLPDWAQEIFSHEFEATTDQKSYKYWLYNDTGNTLNEDNAKKDIWLELEYVSSHDDTSEYVMTKTYSSEADIADAADADDWDYLEVTNITPAVASKVRIKCFIGTYQAGGDIYIDPAVVIS